MSNNFDCALYNSTGQVQTYGFCQERVTLYWRRLHSLAKMLMWYDRAHCTGVLETVFKS